MKPEKPNTLPPLQTKPQPNNQEADKKEHVEQQSNGSCFTCLGIMGCFGGLFIQLVIGSLYQWGIINIYITSYYRTIQPEVTLESNAIAFPLMFISIGITMRLGLFLSEKTHPLVVLAINQILSAAFIFIASYMEDVWLFFLFYGILFGLVAGLSFMIPIVECNKYFPGKKMYVNGVILIGTGMGSVVFGLFSYNFLNPNRLPPQNGYYEGSPELLGVITPVPELLRYLGLLYLCIGMAGVAMVSPVAIHNRKQQNAKKEVMKSNKKQRPDMNQSLEVFKSSQSHNQVENKQLDTEVHGENKPHGQAKTLGQAFCSLICWIEVVILILGSCGSFLINGNYKTYVKSTIDDDEFLTYIGVVAAVGNGCTRFFWNLLFSKTGYKTVTLLNLGISIAVYATIRFTVDLKEVYLIEVFLANSCIGGYLVTTPTMAQALFGQATGSNIYGFYWETFAIANFIQYGYVTGLSNSIGFDNIIYICLGMCALAVPIVIFTTFEGPWKNSTSQLEFCRAGEDQKKNLIQNDHSKPEPKQIRDEESFEIHLKTSKRQKKQSE